MSVMGILQQLSLNNSSYMESERRVNQNILPSGGTTPVIESESWFQSETYLAKIASIMATIVEIRQGLSEDSSLRRKANLALERLGQLANGEIEVEGNKVK